jgi:hypothetical protein
VCDGIDDRHDLVGAVDHRLNERGRLGGGGSSGLLGGDVASSGQESPLTANGDETCRHGAPLPYAAHGLELRHKVVDAPFRSQQFIEALTVCGVPPQVEVTRRAANCLLGRGAGQFHVLVVHLQHGSRVGVDHEHGV